MSPGYVLEQRTEHESIRKMSGAKRWYHGKEAAQIAQDHFVRLFGERRRPEEIPAITPAASETLASLIVSAGFAPTSSHARRLIQQRAVLVNDQIIEDIHFTGFNSRDLIRVGKRNYFEIQ